MAAGQEVKSARVSSLLDIRGWRMGPRLLFAFLAVTAIPLALNGVVGISVSRGALLDQARINLQSHSRNTSAAIDTYLLAHREDIVMVSQLPEVVSYASLIFSGDPTGYARQAALTTLKSAASKPDYESVAIVDARGTIVLSSTDQDLITDEAYRRYFREAFAGNMYISDPSVSFTTNRPALYFSAPIRNLDGKIVAVVRSQLSLDGIWSLVERDKDVAGPGTVGILLDENGIRIAHSASMGNREAIQSTLLYRAVAPVPEAAAQAIVTEKRFGVATEKAIQVLPLPEVAVAVRESRTATFESSADSSTARHFASLNPLTAKPWVYVVMAPLSTFTGSADSIVLYVTAVTVAILFLTGIGVWFMARAITRPIVQITEIADRISLGELDAKIEITRKDEIGELAEAVRRMQASLQAAIERLRARRGG